MFNIKEGNLLRKDGFLKKSDTRTN